MDRLEGVLARAKLPAVFVADFKLMLSFSAFIEEVGGAGGASTSPTSTLELELKPRPSIEGAYSGNDQKSKDWYDLLRHAGGEHAVVKDLEQVPKEVVNNPESLLIWLERNRLQGRVKVIHNDVISWSPPQRIPGKRQEGH